MRWAALPLLGAGSMRSYWRKRASSMQTSCKTEDSSPHPWSPNRPGLPGVDADPQRMGSRGAGPACSLGWAISVCTVVVRSSPCPEQCGILAGSSLDGDMPSLMIVMSARETPESLMSTPRMLASMLRRPSASGEPQGPRHPEHFVVCGCKLVGVCLGGNTSREDGGFHNRVSSDDHPLLAVYIL